MVYTAFTVETLLVFVYKLLTNSVTQPAAAAATPRYVPVADTFSTLWYPHTQTMQVPLQQYLLLTIDYPPSQPIT